MESVLTNFLKENRFGSDDTTVKQRKKKRLNIQPGKSVATINDSDNDNVSMHDELEFESPDISSEEEQEGSVSYEENENASKDW